MSRTFSTAATGSWASATACTAPRTPGPGCCAAPPARSALPAWRSPRAWRRPPGPEEVSSFSKSLFLGEIHEDLVFPFPKPEPAEQDKIRALIAALREVPYDERKVEEERWIGDDTIRELGERGLLGLYVPEEY